VASGSASTTIAVKIVFRSIGFSFRIGAARIRGSLVNPIGDFRARPNLDRARTIFRQHLFRDFRPAENGES
jgi:hypothetical protein